MATPQIMTKFKNSAQTRALVTLAPVTAVSQRIESTHYAEGYAAKFEPYVLYEDEDGPVYERFEPNCFAGADMSDIILQYDHTGRVYARTGNGSLLVEVDTVGLHVAADLSRTDAAKQLYEEIKAGMVTRMSWRFSVGDYAYDKSTRTIVHRAVKKVWDVSAVSIPANNDTEINARSWADGVIGLAARSEAELDERRRRLRLTIKTNL